MSKIDSKKILEMFKYLYNPSFPILQSDGAFVFCRDDPLVAKKASEVYNKGIVDYLMFTGGVGKDSGILAKLGVPEAKFQGALSNILHKVPEKAIHIEQNATNAGECCRFGIDIILGSSLPYENLILLSHPTSLRRADAVMKIIAPTKNFQANYQRVGTDYSFDSTNPLDQKEAVQELLRLADWPKKGWALEQEDIPLNLVNYANEIKDLID